MPRTATPKRATSPRASATEKKTPKRATTPKRARSKGKKRSQTPKRATTPVRAAKLHLAELPKLENVPLQSPREVVQKVSPIEEFSMLLTVLIAIAYFIMSIYALFLGS